MVLCADNKDSVQTGRIPRLIWVFAGHTAHFVGFVVHWLKWARAGQNWQNHERPVMTQLSRSIWGMSWENLFMPYANNKDVDKPRSLTSIFVVHCPDSTTPLVVAFEISRLQLASVAEQAGLNLIWSKIPENTSSREVAHLIPHYHRVPGEDWSQCMAMQSDLSLFDHSV